MDFDCKTLCKKTPSWMLSACSEQWEGCLPKRSIAGLSMPRFLLSSQCRCSISPFNPLSWSSLLFIYPEKNKADNKNKSGRNSSAPERKEERSLALVPMKKSLEMRPGWSLLRRAIMNDRKTSTEKSKISVFQWAMWLPSRWSFSSSIHPDRKPTNPELDPSVNCNEENNVDEDEVKILEELQSLQVKYSSICRLFSYQDLMDATSNFSTGSALYLLVLWIMKWIWI